MRDFVRTAFRLIVTAAYLALAAIILSSLFVLPYLYHHAPLKPDPTQGYVYRYQEKHEVRYLGPVGHTFDVVTTDMALVCIPFLIVYSLIGGAHDFGRDRHLPPGGNQDKA